MTHWVSNGSLPFACKMQRAAYRLKNRDLIRYKQNRTYKINKRSTPTKDAKLLLIKENLSLRKIQLLSTEYFNNKANLSLQCGTCQHQWASNWNNLLSGSSCPKCAKLNRIQTNLIRYGVANPTQNTSIRLKAAKTANKIKELKHWKTEESIFCQGSYEFKIVTYFNKFKINFEAQSRTFMLSNGSTYTPDFLIVDTMTFIEAKGYFYPDAEVKFELFRKEYNYLIEIWGKIKIKQLEELCR